MAIHPEWRPITSTTITRSWLSAVVCRRSIASVAICTAVVKPNVMSVPTMSLSMVFGTPTIGRPRSSTSMLATVSEPLPPMTTSASRPMSANVVGDLLRAVGVVVRAAPPGAEQRAAARQHAAQRAARRAASCAVRMHAVPGIEEADELVAVVQLTLADDGADDRVEAGTIAATCQNADTHDRPV